MKSSCAPESSRTFVSTVLFPVIVLIMIGMEMCIDLILESVIITEEILSVSIVTMEFSSNMSSYISFFSSGFMPATMFLICASTILAVFLYCPNFWFNFCSSEFRAKFSFSWRLNHWPFATCSVFLLVDSLSTSIAFGSCSFGANLGMKGFFISFVICAFPLVPCLLPRAARRTRNDGYDGRLLRVNTRPVWTLNSACDGRISTAVTRCHPSQDGRYARFTGTGKVQNHFCIPLSIYVTHIMRLGLVRHMAS